MTEYYIFLLAVSSFVFALICLLLKNFIQIKNIAIIFTAFQLIQFYSFYQGDFFEEHNISVLFAFITLIVPIFIILLDKTEKSNPGLYYGLILFSQSGMLANIAAIDLMTFYITWELMLLPVFFLIGLYGGKGRFSINLKFLIYTIFGSFLMLASILSINEGSQIGNLYIGLGFLTAIFIKIPVFPFHTWQKDTYHVAPVAGTILLSALMSKLGILAIYKFVIPNFNISEISDLLLSLATFSILYGCLLAWKETNFKKLLAYSSFSHVNFATLGILSLSHDGFTGSIFQVISHAFISTGLFLAISRLRNIFGTYKLNNISGISKNAPRLAIIVFIFILAAISMPLTSGFVAELIIIKASYDIKEIFLLPLLISVVFTAVYFLSAYRKVFFGQPSTDLKTDISFYEFLTYLLLFFIIIVLGIFSNGIIEFLNKCYLGKM